MDKSAVFEETATKVVQIAIARLRHNHTVFAGQFPAYGDGNTGKYTLTPNKNWLAAFWSGLLWLAAHHSGDADDIQRPEALLPSFQPALWVAV